MTASFRNLPESTVEAYVCGKCMYLAAALHRRYGFEIQLALADPGSPHAYIEHAWVIEPNTGNLIDIDGQYPEHKNGWLGPTDQRVTGLNEAMLKEWVVATATRPLPQTEWDLAVEEAEQLLLNHFVYAGHDHSHDIQEQNQ